MVTSAIQSSAASERNFNEKMLHLREYMQFRRLPVKLRTKIEDYYDHRFEGKAFNEEQILKELNPILRSQVCNFNCRALLNNVPLLKYCTPAILDFIAQNLEFESYLAGDQITEIGGKALGMYLIK